MDHALDISLGVLMALFTFRGFLRGMVKELSGLIGIALGFFVASRYYTLVSPHLAPYIGDKQLLVAASYAVIFVGIMLFVTFMGMAIEKFMNFTMGGAVNLFLGGITGFGKGALVSCVVLTLLIQFVSADAGFMKHSYLAEHFNQIWAVGRKLLPPLY